MSHSAGSAFAHDHAGGAVLHKASKVRGFHLRGTDGEIGHVDDFLFDENGRIRYLVVDTSNWIGGRSVLIAPSTIERFDSPNKEIHVRLTREEIKAGPSVDIDTIEPVETLPHIWIM
jgi:hypothetical protein